MTLEFPHLPAVETASGKANETRRRIAQAALDLFSEHGFDGVTTEAIARRAGVTEKTLFRHFTSKKRLFTTTVYPAMLRMIEPLAFKSLRSVLASDYPSLRELMHSVISDRVAFCDQYPEVFKLVVQGVLLHPDFRDSFADFWIKNLLPANKKMLRRARSRDELRDLPDAAVLRAMISLTLCLALGRQLFPGNSKVNRAQQVDHLVDILLHGISIHPAHPARKTKPAKPKRRS